MARIYQHIMKTVLIALVIQVVSPAFLLREHANPVFSSDPSLHTHHCSLIIPQLLKEKEESDSDKKTDDNATTSFVALIDFTDHTSVLTQYHEYKITPFAFQDRFDHLPPLFTLHGVYII